MSEVKAKQELVMWTTAKLKELGHPNPEQWEERLSVLPETHPGEPLPYDMQIVQINRALRYLLVSKPNVSTMDIRMQIIDTNEPQPWKEMMVNVLEFIVKNEY